MKAANIGNAQNVQNLYNQYQNITKPTKEDEKDAAKLFTTPVDTYTSTIEGAADPAKIDQLWKDTNHASDAIRKLITSMLGKDDATGQSFWAVRAKGGFKLNETDMAQAQEMIGEDGFFGVNKTTQRIMDFAKALVGADASEKRINLMRDAVHKGFDEVARMFGGFDKLPDVTKQTYEAIMKAFDQWISGDVADVPEEAAEEAAV